MTAFAADQDSLELSPAESFDWDIEGAGKTLNGRPVPPGHIGLRIGFGACCLDGSRVETVTIVKPAAEMIDWLDRVRAAASEA